MARPPHALRLHNKQEGDLFWNCIISVSCELSYDIVKAIKVSAFCKEASLLELEIKTTRVNSFNGPRYTEQNILTVFVGGHGAVVHLHLVMFF